MSIGAQSALGLMQIVPSTFRSHATKNMGNIWNLIDNMAAAIRYIHGRYGCPYRIPGVFRTNEYKGY